MSDRLRNRRRPTTYRRHHRAPPILVIEARAAEIRLNWTSNQEAERSGREPWTPQEVSVSSLARNLV